MKILAKLLTGFVAVALICGVVGVVGITQLSVASDNFGNIKNEVLPAVIHVLEMEAQQNLLKASISRLAIARGADDADWVKLQNDNIAKFREDYATNLADYEKISRTPEEEKLYQTMLSKMAIAKKFNDEVIELSNKAVDAGPGEERDAYYDKVFSLLNGERRKEFDEGVGAVRALSNFIAKYYGTVLIDQLISNATVSQFILVAVTVVAFLVAIVLGIILGTAISRPLRRSVQVLDKLASGDLSDRLEVKTRDEFAQVAASLGAVTDSLKLLIEEMNHMSKEHDAGDIDVKVDSAKFKGAYHEMAEGVNTMVFGHIAVKKKAMACVMEFGKGNFEAPLERFPGKKVFINDTIEQVRTNLKALIADASMLVDAAVEGKLQTRADATKHLGDFRKIVEGVNKTLDLVIGPVNETIEIMKRLADGDLTAAMAGAYRGDFDVLKTAMNTSLESISDTLSQINIAVDQVAEGSLQVSQASQSLSQGATEQASSLEEITSSVTEVASQTKQNTESAIQMTNLAKTAKQNAEQGNVQMVDLVAAMSDINKSADEIKKIVKAIDDISFQINLLALNANVEAARAGKYGKGFAVVAEEVRNLAVRSANSVKETTRMVDETIANITRGNELVDSTAKQLNEIVSGAAQVATLSEEVATAGKEQAQGLEQISLGLNQIDQVTQANTASAEESASASEELSAQSQEVKQMLARFRLRARDGGKATNAEMMQMVKAELARQGAHKGVPGIAPLAPHAARGALPARKPGAKVNPADVISLDDDNFGKF